mmetsp:Transcript_28780/g.60508  ORF Transcript_28780/g.60508 Transcript_28780/m.60508 type:complete len:109 (-) Transcript_28780:327-653(-)
MGGRGMGGLGRGGMARGCGRGHVGGNATAAMLSCGRAPLERRGFAGRRIEEEDDESDDDGFYDVGEEGRLDGGALESDGEESASTLDEDCGEHAAAGGGSLRYRNRAA